MKINESLNYALATGLWISQGSPISAINKTDCHDITEILLKVALNTINHKPNHHKRQMNLKTLDKIRE
jgi:hypothetical protein